MRNPNGYGTVRHYKGKRRNPYGAFITQGYQICPKLPEISFLRDFLTEDEYLPIKEKYDAYKANLPIKARAKEQCLGWFKTRKDAMMALAEYNRNPYSLDEQAATFADVFQLLCETKLSNSAPATISTYKARYARCSSLYDMRFADIREKDLQHVLDGCRGMSIGTISGVYTLFRSMYAMALNNGIVQRDYSQNVSFDRRTAKKPKEKKVLPPDLIASLWRSENSHADAMLVLLYTGLRASELLALTDDDIHLEERWMHVRGTKTGNADRVVPLHRDILPVMQRHLGSGKPFPGSYNQLRDAVQKITSGRFTAHECRHTFITAATECGVDIVCLRKMVGHSSGVTEDVYTHISTEILISEIDKLRF